ncbi:transposase [Actinacidiphila glaucinigra]|uniref:Putative transposase of IS4/5 family n=1 Tax=Actinacidiphila glaucinigra TaxID=235986 RepID=A0A239MRW5_9ACTN|nr:transposase [Actinacidiphila glaucinigra]SNT44882.1 Putative transposase of IS4/5 family [Actinacidiphila glaucinigra]
MIFSVPATPGETCSAEYGPWSSVYDRFRIWTCEGVFQHLMETVIGYAAERGEVDLSLASVDSAASRAHHHAAGMVLDEEQLKTLVEAAESGKGAGRRDKSRKTNRTEARNEPSGGCGDAAAGRV